MLALVQEHFFNWFLFGYTFLFAIVQGHFVCLHLFRDPLLISSCSETHCLLTLVLGHFLSIGSCSRNVVFIGFCAGTLSLEALVQGYFVFWAFSATPFLAFVQEHFVYWFMFIFSC